MPGLTAYPPRDFAREFIVRACPADDGNIVTANDIRGHAGEGAAHAGRRRAAISATRDITYWVSTMPAPRARMRVPAASTKPSASGVKFAEVWQFAQSPQRKDVAAHCTNYSRDGNCYPPGIAGAQRLPVDLNAAISADPSHGRR